MHFDWRHALIIVATILVFGIFAWFNLGDYPTIKNIWFYDLNSGTLFVGSARSAPPIASPTDSGDNKSGVIAQVIRIEGDEQQHVVFLQTFTPEAQIRRQNILTSGKGPDAENQEGNRVDGTLVALPPKSVGEKPEWVDATQPNAISFPLRAATIANGRPYYEDLP